MQLHFFPISFWFELLSLLISIILIKKLRGSFLIYFIPILFVIILAEFYGTYLKFVSHKPNGWVYNILSLIQFPFWINLFRYNFKGGSIKKLCVFLAFLFSLFALSNILFLQGFNFFNKFEVLRAVAHRN